MSSRSFVDAHQHFWWNPSEQDYPWITDDLVLIRRTFSPEDLRPSLTESGVEYTVLVQTRSSLEETRRFLGLAANTEFIAGVVGWVDLTDPDVHVVIEDLRSGDGGEYLVGIRHQVHDEQDPQWLLRDDVLRGLEAVDRAGLVYDLLVRTRELPAACEVARRFPDLRLVVDHIAKPPIRAGDAHAWSEAMSPLSDFRNVYCKLSGMVTEADWSTWKPDDLVPFTDRVLGWFGADRLMFGSDWPVCLLAASYAEVLNACRYAIRGRPDEAQRAIFGATARRCYGLRVAESPGRGEA